jgi:hypothetical protein
MAVLCGALVALPCAAQEGGTKEETPEQAAPAAEPEAEAEKPAAEAEKPPAKKKSNLEEEPMHRWGAWSISLAVWDPQQIGVSDEVAVIVPDDQPAYPLRIDPESSWRGSIGAAFHLPKDRGSVVVRYDSMSHESQDDFFSPGQFIYFESQAVGFRGVFDDGYADGVRTSGLYKTREFRLDYQNTAWSTPRTRGTWSAGVRSIDHSEELELTYFALVPNFPALIPPAVESTADAAALIPLPDRVRAQSDYSATGAGAALDVEFKFHPRFSIVSGLAVGLLTGDMSSRYKSKTYLYINNAFQPPVILTPEELLAILSTGTAEDIALIEQVQTVSDVYSPNVKHASQTYEAYVGVQSTVWRGLKVFATFRELYYSNVGERLGLSSQGITTASKSVGYEGYLVGVSWRF